MSILRRFLDAQQQRFQSGGKLDRLYPLFEAVDTILYTPGKVTTGTTHVRAALDLKRMMTVVVAGLIPIVFFAMYNTGLQASRAIAAGAQPLDTWQTQPVPGHGLRLHVRVLVVFCLWRPLLHPGLRDDFCGRRNGRGDLCLCARPRDQRRFLCHRVPAASDAAADHSPVAGGHRSHLRRTDRQRGFRRYRDEYSQPGPDGPRLSVLCLPG